MSQWGLSESVLPLHSCIVKNSLHCFPGWTWLQMAGNLIHARPGPAGGQTEASWPASSWLGNREWLQLLLTRLNISKRTESCWPRLPPSSKTLGPFQLGRAGKVDKLQRELSAESLALICELATSGLTGGGFQSPNEPRTAKVALKRKKKKERKKQFLDDASSKGPHVYLSWKILVFVCFNGAWADVLRLKKEILEANNKIWMRIY